MWIVALALRRPYTFIVMALLLLILSPIVIFSTPTDIFPEINIPVISIVWNYQGLAPKDMANRITTITERGLTTLVNDIDHIESESMTGIAVVKIYFRQQANIQTALSQVTAISQTALTSTAPGNHTAADYPVFRLYRADSTTRFKQQHAS